MDDVGSYAAIAEHFVIFFHQPLFNRVGIPALLNPVIPLDLLVVTCLPHNMQVDKTLSAPASRSYSTASSPLFFPISFISTGQIARITQKKKLQALNCSDLLQRCDKL